MTRYMSLTDTEQTLLLIAAAWYGIAAFAVVLMTGLMGR